MKKWIAFGVIFFTALAVKAQYVDGPDRYFYEEEFDWRWDVRVRISDGTNSGYLTRREANRLYRRLEDIERKEWAFQSDGYYSPWEQDEIWLDVVDLNRAIGLELSDWDRRYYGYSGIVITGPLHWYFGPSYDFYRFDKRGYGTIIVGYVPRHYHPMKHVYYTKRNNYTAHWENRPARVSTPARNSHSGSRGYSERGVQSSRTAAPERASTSGRTSRVPERTNTSERRMESSERRMESSERRMESSRSSAPGASSGRGEAVKPERSSRTAPAASENRSSSRSTGSERTRSSGAKSSVERAGNSQSSGSSVNRSARTESTTKNSSRSSGGRSRD